MSFDQTTTEIEYPESDGKPMGETDLHIEWIIRIRDILKLRYRGQQVYVANDLLVYYQEGDPKKFFVPDCFVVKDCDPGRRRTFKIWEEGRVPNVAFEFTSASTQSDDTVLKPRLYARIGIQEYFIYDPTSDYLQPPLQGYRLNKKNEYIRIEPDHHGALTSEQLAVLFHLEGTSLVMSDLATGERLLSQSEAEHAAREMEHAAREMERAARQAAEARADDAEAELERLREQLKRLGGDA